MTRTTKSRSTSTKMRAMQNPNNTNNSMMKMKSNKKDLNNEFSLKRISLCSRKLIFLEFPKLKKSRNSLSPKKPVSSSLILTKSTAGGSALMLSSGHTNCLTSTKTTSSVCSPLKTKLLTSKTSTSTPSVTTASSSPKVETTSTSDLSSPKSRSLRTSKASPLRHYRSIPQEPKTNQVILFSAAKMVSFVFIDFN